MKKGNRPSEEICIRSVASRAGGGPDPELDAHRRDWTGWDGGCLYQHGVVGWAVGKISSVSKRERESGGGTVGNQGVGRVVVRCLVQYTGSLCDAAMVGRCCAVLCCVRRRRGRGGAALNAGVVFWMTVGGHCTWTFIWSSSKHPLNHGERGSSYATVSFFSVLL